MNPWIAAIGKTIPWNRLTATIMEDGLLKVDAEMVLRVTALDREAKPKTSGDGEADEGDDATPKVVGAEGPIVEISRLQV